jgi:hypothetical protein
MTPDVDSDFVPSPVHRAIDHVTSLLLQLHQLRRHTDDGTPIDLAQLDQMETALLQIAAVLVDCRDREQNLSDENCGSIHASETD